MENNELLKRAEDLYERCQRKSCLSHTNFLSPAESYEIRKWAKHVPDCSIVFSGGGEDCERTAAFFLPYYMDEESFDVSEYISAIKLTARFGSPGHRDYMGAVLGMGVGREWVGDIRVLDSTAFVYCMPGVCGHLAGIEKVGRVGVRAEIIPLSEVPAAEKKVKELSFTVMSLRLDAVVGGLFGMSRTEAAKQINSGSVSLNYSQCLRTDMPVKKGDVISLRGSGKAAVSGIGGTSRRGRIYVQGERYL
ncbi:MAG: RNA-binding protein [Candidatus Limivicinus sp.]|jgi:RNA-binding protein YlmH